MHIGFTGPRKGMATLQAKTFHALIEGLRTTRDCLHHGDCVGADAEAHIGAQAAGYHTHVHPPDKADFRAFCKEATTTSPPRPYLKRNQDIVNACTLLIATPPGFEEQRRSGIWSTVRRARKAKISRLIIWPDGSASVGLPEGSTQKIALPPEATEEAFSKAIEDILSYLVSEP